MAKVLWGTVANRCPRCFEGKVFSGFLRMSPDCDRCGLVFDREYGYFTGAMVASYGIGAVAAFPLFFVLAATGASTAVAVGAPSLLLVALSPFLTRYSRLAWLHVDHGMLKEREDEAP